MTKRFDSLKPHLFFCLIEGATSAFFIILQKYFIDIFYILNQIDYYEQFFVVKICFIAAPLLLIIAYAFFKLYKYNLINIYYFNVVLFILMGVWILLKTYVSSEIKIITGTEHFFYNFYIYFFGILIVVVFAHYLCMKYDKWLEEFIKIK